MKLPKKLTHVTQILSSDLVVEDLVLKVNQIIDYLLDKEDPEQIIKAYNDLLDRQHEGEASKGEVKSDDSKTSEPDYTHCGHCGVKFGDEDNPELHDINCFYYKKHPPQQEESRGEWNKISEILKVVGFTNNDKVHGNIVRCNRDLGELKKELLSLIKPQLKEESPKEDDGRDLLSNCCAWDFDPLGFEKEEGIWQERCGRCGRLCEPIYLSKRDILNIQRCKTMETA